MIYHLFQTLAQISSKNEKIALLLKHKEDVLLRQVCFLALDPFTQFYVRKVPIYEARSTLFKEVRPLSWALEELSKLSNRIVTGNAAINHLRNVLEQLTTEDADIIERIIKKDLRCGVAESTVNKVWKGLVQVYPVMLATPFDQALLAKFRFPALAQLKLDGMRFNAIIQNNEVTFRARSGKELFLRGALEREFLDLTRQASKFLETGNIIFDGELLVLDRNGNPLPRQTGNGILNKANKDTITTHEASLVAATVWDVIPRTSFELGYYNKTYAERFSVLKELQYPAKTFLVDTYEVQSVEEATDTFQRLYDQGQEGIILKDKRSPWENKRSKWQIKFKGEIDADLLCVDWIEGTGKYAGVLGSLVVQTKDGRIQVNVGTGFSDEERKSLKREDVVGKIVAVQYNSVTRDVRTDKYSLFLPRFLEIREDKTEADNINIKDV